jgi:hypothetical protein
VNFEGSFGLDEDVWFNKIQKKEKNTFQRERLTKDKRNAAPDGLFAVEDCLLAVTHMREDN